MGQNNSLDKSLVSEVEDIHKEILRQARSFSEIAALSYDDFKAYLLQLNALSDQCMDAEGMRLLFVVKKGTDTSLLWKSTIRIACVKIGPDGKSIDSYRLMNLNEFLKVFRSLNSQYMVAQHISSCEEAAEEMVSSCNRDGSSSEVASTSNNPIAFSELTASKFFNEVDKVTKDEDQLYECCICLERKPNTMLPCAHSYCQTCIDQWNVDHNTCPICREELESSDDAWVISEAPNTLEISEEICSTLMDIVKENSRTESQRGGGYSYRDNGNINGIRNDSDNESD